MNRTLLITARHRAIFGLSVLMLFFGLMANTATAAETERTIQWTLGSASVLNAGTTQNLAEGSFVKDHVFEATAISTDQDFIPQGKLRLMISVFAPKTDLGEQKKGNWYVTGKWELLDDNADTSGNIRNQPGKISGLFTTELTFDPISSTRVLDVETKLPFANFIAVGEQGAGQKLRGEGSLSFGVGHAGKLSLQLKLLSKLK